MKREKSEVHLSRFSNFEDKLTIIIKRKKKKKKLTYRLVYFVSNNTLCLLQFGKGKIRVLEFKEEDTRKKFWREKERGKRDGKRIGTRPLEASSPPPPPSTQTAVSRYPVRSRGINLA